MTSSTLTHRPQSPHISRIAAGVFTTLCLISGTALANPYARGPAPTLADLEAAAGPFAVSTQKISSASGYGGGTVYYPTSSAEGSYGIVAIAPGFTNTQAFLSQWGPKLASHGFVVVNMNTTTIFDQPESRGKQLMAALKQITTLSQTKTTPYYGKVDPSRQAVMGYSMGGGGTLAAARDNPGLKAAFALAPWHTLKDFSKVTVPTMILACQSDIVAPIDSHSQKFYASLSATPAKAYLEIKGGDHFCPSNNGTAEMKVTERKFGVAWLKRFLDEDTRYTPFLQPLVNDAIVSDYKTSGSL
ncbi:MAG TPA: dienelactone hydrolase family protein [Aquabacterium sp.]|uniref:alpha/beta hydrolase family protein n=1 Tax=Aquabacterium sp. TaxID=1872578 RepID=UPI002E325C91|nr:dienelactone hydrolase family protein [Aquabacterium sp.]HEX5373101.1 dienelactone hydrolase family protein [Aquabacterium sp.]